MDALQRRRSRFSRRSGRTKVRGQRRRIELTPRDLVIFKLLLRYRYLPSNFIVAFVGGSRKHLLERLTDLFHEGYLGRPRRQWNSVNARYKPAIYELDVRAKHALRENGIQIAHRVGFGRDFAHEFMVCVITASFELATRSVPSMEYLTAEQVLEHERTPAATRRAKTPFRIPVTVEHDGEYRKITLKPDGRPSVIRYGGVALCFLGHEADRCTEPEEPLNIFDRSNIELKMRAYLAIERSQIYKSHYGFPNMIVPFVTISAKRKKGMMDVLANLTGGKGTRFIIFKVMADLTSFEKAPEPTPAFLFEPWERLGHPPFDILAELTKAAERAAA